MATAAIPLALSIISILAPHIPSVIQFVENLFGKGTGATKLATATKLVQVAVDSMAAAGTLPGLATTEQITALIQGTFDDLQRRGLINAPASTSPPIVPAMSNLAIGALLQFLGAALSK